MRLRAGTSGFQYKEWKGSFYPEDLAEASMLAYYAERLDAVEVNNTFYRMPKAATVRKWAGETPEGFRFCLKAPMRITHKKRLQEAEEEIAFFTASARELGSKLGPALFQLPPWFRKDAERLRGFLAQLPAGFPAAFEFRHESWFDEEVFGILRERGAALVVAEDEEGETPLVPTAPFGYLRLRRQDYGDPELARWGERVRAQPWEEAHVFFKHEDAGAGPRLAARFRELFGGR
jgi:uncharacterized protein YecE (DUF72 family)